MYVDANGVHADQIDPDWIPTLEDGRWDNRLDIRWAHPDTHPLYAQQEDADSLIMEARVNDPGSTHDERVRLRDEHAAWMEAFCEGLDLSGLDRKKYVIDGLCEGDPQLEVLVVRPEDRAGEKLDVAFCFGQASMTENPESMSKFLFERYCRELGIAVVYALARTGIDCWYPKPLDDYEAAYRWMLANAKELGLKAKNVVLMGGSGGGYAALAFAFRCKRVGLSPKGAVLVNPVMGDNMVYPSSRIVTALWDALDVQRAFKTVIRPGDGNSPFVSPEVVPSRATVDDCRGLCPIIIHANELDADRDPSMAFAEKCYEAKVFTQIHVWGGCPHGGADFAGGRLGESFRTVYLNEIRDLFEHDFRRQWLAEG